MPRLTVDHTKDEFGQDRFFVADENGDWIGEPHSTREAALAAAAYEETQPATWLQDQDEILEEED